MEVCSLSGGIMFQPLSEPLQPGIRFFQPPLPALPTASLTVGLPLARRKYGLTEFHFNDTSGLGAAYPPVVICQRIPRCNGNDRPCTFLVEACQLIWLLAADDGYSSSHQFTMPPSLASHPHLACRICITPHGATHREGITLSGCFAHHRYQ